MSARSVGTSGDDTGFIRDFPVFHRDIEVQRARGPRLPATSISVNVEFLHLFFWIFVYA